MPILDHNGHPFPPSTPTVPAQPRAVQPRQQGRVARMRDHQGSLYDPPDDMALPHVWTFSSVLGSAYRTYWHDRWDEAMRHAREDAIVMRNDSHLMRLLQERKLAVAGLPWHLKVPDEHDAYQVKVRDDLTARLKMWRGFTKFRYTLQEALWYGRFANQVKWKWVNASDTPGGRALMVQKWLPVNGDKIGHAYDGTPYVLVYSPAAQGLSNAELTLTTRGWGLVLRGDWRERFIIHTHEVEDMDFFDAEAAEAVHGRGIRSVLFWTDWIKREWLANACTFMQRTGLGMTVWYYEAGNPDSEAQASQAAKEQSGRVNILWPRSANGKGTGSGVERIEVPTGGAAFLLEAQKWLGQLEELYVIGQTMSSGQDSEGSLGGTGRANFAKETKLAIRDFDAQNQADSLTGDEDNPGLIYLMQRWTWPGTVEHFPVWFEYDLEASESKDKLEALSKAWEMGASLKEEDVLKSAGASQPTVGDRILSRQQQEQQQQAMQVQAQGQQQQAELQAQQQSQAADRQHQLQLETLRGQQRAQEQAQQPIIRQYFQGKRPARYAKDQPRDERGRFSARARKASKKAREVSRSLAEWARESREEGHDSTEYTHPAHRATGNSAAAVRAGRSSAGALAREHHRDAAAEHEAAAEGHRGYSGGDPRHAEAARLHDRAAAAHRKAAAAYAAQHARRPGRPARYYDPSEPRGGDGRWTAGAGGGGSNGKPARKCGILAKAGKAGRAVRVGKVLEHRLMSAVKAHVPPKLQKVASLAIQGVFSTWIPAQKAAYAIAKEVGGEKHAKKVSRMLIAADLLGAKTAAPLIGAVSGGTAGTVAYMTPLASSAYVAFASVRHPKATFEAARKAVAAVRDKVAGLAGHKAAAYAAEREPQGYPKEAVAALYRGLQAAGEHADWYEALVYAALEMTGGDLGQATEAADAAMKEGLPDAYRLAGVPERYNTPGFDPNEPRDALGRWTAGGTSHRNEHGQMMPHGRERQRQQTYITGLQHWEDRKAEREEQQSQCEDIANEDAYEALGGETVAAVNALDPWTDRESSKLRSSEEGRKQYRARAEEWGRASAELFGRAHQEQLDRLKELGVSDKQAERVGKLIAKGKEAVQKAADKYLTKLDRADAAQARYDAHLDKEPVEPDEPDSEAPQEEHDKYEAALAQWEQASSQWESKKDNLEQASADADDAENEAHDAIEEVRDRFAEKVAGAMQDAASEVYVRLEKEQDADEEPEELDSTEMEPEVAAAHAAIEKGLDALAGLSETDEEADAFNDLQSTWQELGNDPAYDHQTLADYLDAGKQALAVFSRDNKPAAVQAVRQTMADALRALRAIYARVGVPVRYAADQGRWVTIGGSKGEDGKRHGGSPVFIKDGKITKGAPGLTGKKLGDMTDADEGHRIQARRGKEYATARLVKEARKEGIKPKDLHALAGEVLAHDKAHVEDRTKALQLARRIAESFGTSLQTLKARSAHGIDADQVKHLDDIATSVAASHPEQFAGHEDLGERLFSMLAEGNPKAMSEQEAYEQALEHLRERAGADAGREPWDSGDIDWSDDGGPVPF